MEKDPKDNEKKFWIPAYDLYVKAPLWAIVILLIFGVIAAGTLWFLITTVKPKLDKIKKKNKQTENVIGIHKSRLTESVVFSDVHN